MQAVALYGIPSNCPLQPADLLRRSTWRAMWRMSTTSMVRRGWTTLTLLRTERTERTVMTKRWTFPPRAPRRLLPHPPPHPPLRLCHPSSPWHRVLPRLPQFSRPHRWSRPLRCPPRHPWPMISTWTSSRPSMRQWPGRLWTHQTSTCRPLPLTLTSAN